MQVYCHCELDISGVKAVVRQKQCEDVLCSACSPSCLSLLESQRVTVRYSLLQRVIITGGAGIGTNKPYNHTNLQWEQ